MKHSRQQEEARLLKSAAIADLDYDEDYAKALVKQSIEIALPRALQELDEYAQIGVKNLDDYDQLRIYVGSALRYAEYLGVDIARRIAVAQHIVVFQKSRWHS